MDWRKIEYFLRANTLSQWTSIEWRVFLFVSTIINKYDIWNGRTQCMSESCYSDICVAWVACSLACVCVRVYISATKMQTTNFSGTAKNWRTHAKSGLNVYYYWLYGLCMACSCPVPQYATDVCVENIRCVFIYMLRLWRMNRWWNGSNDNGKTTETARKQTFAVCWSALHEPISNEISFLQI